MKLFERRLKFMNVGKFFCDNKYVVGSVIIMVLFLCLCGNNQFNSKGKTEIIQDNIGELDGSVFSKYSISEDIISKIDIIPNEKIALKVSTEILQSVYGKDNIKDIKPFKVIFDSEYDVWVVSGTLKPNTVGGVPTIIMQKRDGKIIAITHTK